MNYSLERHIELLNHEKEFASQNKFFFDENQAEFFELCTYNIAVENHIFWENRFEVASLMESFLKKEINAEEFHDSVFGLRRNHLAKCNKFRSRLVSGEIKEFCPNKKSIKLQGFLSSLYFECEDFEMNFDEEPFYNSIRNGFLKFQKILKEEY